MNLTQTKFKTTSNPTQNAENFLMTKKKHFINSSKLKENHQTKNSISKKIKSSPDPPIKPISISYQRNCIRIHGIFFFFNPSREEAGNCVTEIHALPLMREKVLTQLQSFPSTWIMGKKAL